MLGISVTSVRNWVREGRIPEPATRRGNRRYWTAEQVRSVASKRAKLDQKARGAYFTPPEAARAMTQHLLDDLADGVVLEPSAGDGAFCDAVLSTTNGLQVLGYEIDSETANGLSKRFSEHHDVAIHCTDFLRSDCLADAVIGNPPFVRLRAIESQLANRALAALRAIGLSPDTSGSYWIAVVAKAIQSLREGGRLSLILPWEATHVRYARGLWKVLGSNFGYVAVSRIADRVFPHLSQDVIILECRDRGARTDVVHMRCFSDLEDYAHNIPTHDNTIDIARIDEGHREFALGLLPPRLRSLVSDVLCETSIPLQGLATFHIGYVCGNKQFFHPDPATVARFSIPDSSLDNAIVNSASLRGSGLYTSAVSSPAKVWLPSDLSDPGDESYASYGMTNDVHTGYKCRVRTPWWRIPGVDKADLVLSGFSSDPHMLINDAEMVATNSLLCGTITGRDAASVVRRWYSAVTRISVELDIHSLGGGVLVMIPGEVAKLRVLGGPVPAYELTELDSALRQRDFDAAYRLADDVLAERIGVEAVNSLWEAVSILRGWRERSVK